MSIDYALTLEGGIALERLAEVVAPHTAELRSPAGGRLLTADLNDEFGYTVTITSGSDGYYAAEDDGGSLWQWEPDQYVDITFHLRKDTVAEQGRPNMLRAVAAILGRWTREDAALLLNGDWLMLTRVDGRFRKHNAADWYREEYDQIFTGTGL
ncbi:SitI3 family protein [Micromonospora krabiensis]|uniref:Uncharacterized protein n=1 Tax=Micromonospora krabiensis TaxID=307121 RepID=A0A1C3N558_9ACTN|nr:SitI3 family protein [Micromonospora krabiensis]SBV27703.1 hypothetical protein GA0070620_3229 [Micromonospora krabiensis]